MHKNRNPGRDFNAISLTWPYISSISLQQKNLECVHVLKLVQNFWIAFEEKNHDLRERLDHHDCLCEVRRIACLVVVVVNSLLPISFFFLLQTKVFKSFGNTSSTCHILHHIYTGIQWTWTTLFIIMTIRTQAKLYNNSKITLLCTIQSVSKSFYLFIVSWSSFYFWYSHQYQWSLFPNLAIIHRTLRIPTNY